MFPRDSESLHPNQNRGLPEHDPDRETNGRQTDSENSAKPPNCALDPHPSYTRKSQTLPSTFMNWIIFLYRPTCLVKANFLLLAVKPHYMRL
jgi:hypothetical protein